MIFMPSRLFKNGYNIINALKTVLLIAKQCTNKHYYNGHFQKMNRDLLAEESNGNSRGYANKSIKKNVDFQGGQ